MSSPIYIKIHNEIRQRIEDGEWAVGDRIPAERELAEQFGVSRMTLRQAIQTLVDEGLLERHIGAGTFVHDQNSLPSEKEQLLLQSRSEYYLHIGCVPFEGLVHLL